MRTGYAAALEYTIREDWTSALNLYDVHAASTDRFTTYPTEAGRAARFECRPGDDSIYSERSEVVLGTWSFSNSWKITGNEPATEFFRFAVKLESPWLDVDVNPSGYKWGTPFQIHGQQALSPAFALQLEGLRYRALLMAGDCTNPVSASRELLFSDDSLRVGEWVEFVVEIKWSLTTSGHCVVYRMNANESNFKRVTEAYNIPTLQYIGLPQIRNHYTKTGIYRSASSHTSIVHIGPVMRTTNRSRALSGARSV